MDDKAYATICLGFSHHHLDALGRQTTAKAAWDYLKDTLHPKSQARVLQLRRELASLSMQPNESLHKFFSRAKTLRDLLIDASATNITDSEVLRSIASALPADYDPTVGTIGPVHLTHRRAPDQAASRRGAPLPP